MYYIGRSKKTLEWHHAREESDSSLRWRPKSRSRGFTNQYRSAEEWNDQCHAFFAGYIFMSVSLLCLVNKA